MKRLMIYMLSIMLVACNVGYAITIENQNSIDNIVKNDETNQVLDMEKNCKLSVDNLSVDYVMINDVFTYKEPATYCRYIVHQDIYKENYKGKYKVDINSPPNHDNSNRNNIDFTNLKALAKNTSKLS